MLTDFGDSKGPILEHYLEKGRTINSARYSDLLANNLKPAIRTKRRDLLSKKMLLHDSARLHTAGQTVETINYLGFEVLEHPAYSQDLFGPLKDALRCCPFSTDKEEREAVHKWLRVPPKTFFWREYASLWTAGPSASKRRRLYSKLTYLFNPCFCVYKVEKNKSADNFLLSYVIIMTTAANFLTLFLQIFLIFRLTVLNTTKFSLINSIILSLSVQCHFDVINYFLKRSLNRYSFWDYAVIYNYLSSYYLSSLYKETSVDAAIGRLNVAVTLAIDLGLPSGYLKKHKDPAWVSGNLKAYIKKENCLCKCYKKCLSVFRHIFSLPQISLNNRIDLEIFHW
jgi:hypothetical protein